MYENKDTDVEIKKIKDKRIEDLNCLKVDLNNNSDDFLYSLYYCHSANKYKKLNDKEKKKVISKLRNNIYSEFNRKNIKECDIKEKFKDIFYDVTSNKSVIKKITKNVANDCKISTDKVCMILENIDCDSFYEKIINSIDKVDFKNLIDFCDYLFSQIKDSIKVIIKKLKTMNEGKYKKIKNIYILYFNSIVEFCVDMYVNNFASVIKDDDVILGKEYYQILCEYFRYNIILMKSDTIIEYNPNCVNKDTYVVIYEESDKYYPVLQIDKRIYKRRFDKNDKLIQILKSNE